MKGIVLYKDTKTIVDMLPDEKAGKLFKAVFAYTTDGTIPKLDEVTAIAFTAIKTYLDRDAEKYERVCEKRRESGSLGGKQKVANAKQMLPNDSKSKQNVASVANIKRNINRNINTNIKSNTISTIVDAWNSLSAVGVPSIRMIASGSKRYKALTARLNEYSEEDILKAIDNIKQSKFLQGKNERGWVITFDWLLLPSNFQKVLEGNYQDREGEKKKDANSMMMSRNYDWEELEKQLLAAQ